MADDIALLATLAEMAAFGMDADELVVVMDTCVSSSDLNAEGKAWKRGEMQERKDEPVIKAMLTDALMLLAVKQGAERAELWQCIYKVEDGQVVWGTVERTRSVERRIGEASASRFGKTLAELTAVCQRVGIAARAES